MEKINEHNYEAFFLDYIEGNLNDAQLVALFAFLKAHPALKSNLEEDFRDIILIPTEYSLENKDSLKIVEDDLTVSGLDDLMIASVEGELTIEEENDLKIELKKNKLTHEYKVYQHTILNPDFNEVFVDKESLKREKSRLIPFYIRITAAAAAIVLLFSLFYNPDSAVEMDGFVKSGTVLSDVIEETAPTDNQIKYNGNGFVEEKITIDQSPQEKNNHQFDELVKSIQLDTIMDTVKFIVPTNLDDDPIVDSPIKEIPKEIDRMNPDIDSGDEIGDVAIADNIVQEEKLQFFTKAVGNVLNTDVAFLRDRNTVTDKYVTFQFKIGKFEFERKKSH